MELKPDWVVGFTDGEGCFYVGVNPHPEMSAGYQILPEFRIVQHQRDMKILYALKKFFRAGVVRRNHGDRYEVRIRKLSTLKEVVAFFEKHPLQTGKNADFKAFARIIRMMTERKHLLPEGIRKIKKIASRMNRGKRQQDKDKVHATDESGGSA